MSSPIDERTRQIRRMKRVLTLVPVVYKEGAFILYWGEGNTAPHNWVSHLPVGQQRLIHSLSSDERQMLRLIQALVVEIDSESLP